MIIIGNHSKKHWEKLFPPILHFVVEIPVSTTKWKSQVTGIVIARVRRCFCLKRRWKNVLLGVQSRTGVAFLTGRQSFLRMELGSLLKQEFWIAVQLIIFLGVWSPNSVLSHLGFAAVFCRHQKLQKRIAKNQNGSLGCRILECLGRYGRPQGHDPWSAYGNKACKWHRLVLLDTAQTDYEPNICCYL